MSYTLDVRRGTTALGMSILATAPVWLTGCGEAHPPTYPVSGQVVFPDGSTLRDGGKVVFFHTESSPPIRARGYFGSDGKFVLSTYKDGDGAIAGDHEVTVVPTVPNDQGNLSTKEYLRAMQPIADRFKNPKGSGIRLTVSPETAPHDVRIEVRPPRRR